MKDMLKRPIWKQSLDKTKGKEKSLSMYIPRNKYIRLQNMAFYQRSPLAANRLWWWTMPWVSVSLLENVESLILSKSVLSKQNKFGEFVWAFMQSRSTAAEQPLLVPWLKTLYVLEVFFYRALKWTWKTSRYNCKYHLAEKTILLFQSSKVSGDWMHSWWTINLWILKSYKTNKLMSYVGCYQN